MKVAELLDTIISLTALMEEESEALALRGRHPDLAEISLAKARLVGMLEARDAQLARENPLWLQELPDAARADLTEAYLAMRDASIVNADVLARQIELSSDMIAAVASEVQRLSGGYSTTYGAHGGLWQVEQATPISLNTRL